MKILAISDTHIKSSADLRKIDAALRPYVAQVDAILHAGDMVIPEVYEALSAIKPTYVVAGNIDPADAWERFGERRVIELGGFRIGLIHGWGPASGLEVKVRQRFERGAVDCVVFGHSHHPYVGMVSGIFMVNPGSLFDRRFAPSNSFAILTLGEKIEVEIIEV